MTTTDEPTAVVPAQATAPVAEQGGYTPTGLAVEAARSLADPRPPAQPGQVFGEIKQLRLPMGRAATLAAEMERGRTEARKRRDAIAAGEMPPTVADGSVAEQVEAAQREARESALDACLPLNREDALRGFAGLDDDQHADGLAAWLADRNARTLILAGRTGSGKTQAAYATAVEAATRCGAAMIGRNGVVRTRHLLVRSWAVTRYLAELRPDGSPDPGWLTRHKARTAELLILDDLGAETDKETTEFIRRELVQLLDDRAEARLRTIITTNLPSKQISERFGHRFYSRLVQDAAALQFLGHDRRNLRQLEW